MIAACAGFAIWIAAGWPDATAAEDDAAVSPDSWSLRYSEPAEEWVEALPIGNGHMGAMVFGRTDRERIQFNEDTLWTSRPKDYQNPGAVEALPELRNLLFQGNQEEAHELAMQQFMSNPLRQSAFQPFGDLHLNSEGHNNASGYRRWLDLDSAVTGASYTVDGVRYTREVFASYPDRIIVVRLSADTPGALNFQASLSSPHEVSRQSVARPDELALAGRVTQRARGQDHESRMTF